MDCHRTGNETLILLHDDKRESMDNKTTGKSASWHVKYANLALTKNAK